MPKNISCQHLHDKEIQYCRVFIDGVFIPMSPHLDHFCRSGNCGECFQFMKSQEHLQLSQKRLQTAIRETRRQHLRFSQTWQLFIAEEEAPLDNYKIFENKAQTIDISTSGFRIVSRKKLHPSQRVHFLFENSLAAPFTTGLGEVKWNKTHSTGGFESGLALV